MKTIKDKNYSFNHVKKRLTERYNLDITMSEYDIMNLVTILDIPKNIEHQKNDTQFIYDIMFKKKMIRIVWSDEKNLVTTVLPPIKQHHIWCNNIRGNPDTCKMCAKFNKKYPMDGKTPDDLLKEHFPDAIKREGT